MNVSTTRRGFLKGTAAVSGAVLVVGFDGGGALAAQSAVEFNPFVKIDAEGVVTVVLKHFEMGQGTTTGLTTLIVEELDADWDDTQIEFAPAHPSYNHTYYPIQGTGGSNAIANSWMQYRQAGAAARAMLVAAAAPAWGVSPNDVTIDKGVIRSGGRSGGFGDFVAAAARVKPPANPALKQPSAFRLIGREHLPRKDSAGKTDGSAIFAMDVRIPGMVYAVILRPPRPGARLTSFDADPATEKHGYIGAVALPTGAGVVVYARSTWAAIEARSAIAAEWDFAAAETRSSDEIAAAHRSALDTPQIDARPSVDRTATEAALSGAARTIEADFLMPYLAHAPMEPLNCVIEPTEAGVRVHDGCQAPGISKPFVAGALGLKPDQVEIHTVYAGGSFGRRGSTNADYGVEAALAFKLLGGGTPVKLVWTREDDVRGGYYRPMAAHRVRIGLDALGHLVAWDHRIATQSMFKGSSFESFLVRNGVDHASVEGVYDTPYAIPNMSVGLTDIVSPIKVLWWRSVGNSHTAYAMEVALDMVAEAAGRDPVAYRLDLLASGTGHQRRLAGVLKHVAEKAGWGQSSSERRFNGVAVHMCFGTYVAEVAEVSVNDDGAIRIEKIICAVDCGVAVNPDVIRAQMEGAIGYGLGAAMRNEISFTDGAVDQSNFHDYEPLVVSDIGDVEVHIVPSAEAPTGVGEPGLPPALPAVANAIFAATGKRLLEMPWRKHVTFV